MAVGTGRRTADPADGRRARRAAPAARWTLVAVVIGVLVSAFAMVVGSAALTAAGSAVVLGTLLIDRALRAPGRSRGASAGTQTST